jgi:hypothetical protein
MLKNLIYISVALVMTVGAASSATATEGNADHASGRPHPVVAVKKAAKTIGHGVKEGGRAVGHGFRDVARSIGHGTRDVTRTAGHSIRHGVHKVEGKEK